MRSRPSRENRLSKPLAETTSRLRIGIVEFRSVLGDKRVNVSKALEILAKAAKKSVDILVFPELWSTGYLAGSMIPELAESIPGPTTEILAKSCVSNSIFLVGGSIAEAVDGEGISDTLFVIDRNGTLVAKHRKAHLFRSYEKHYFSRGNTCTVIDTEFGKLGFGICYDGDFAEYSRILALEGTKIFFNPSAYAKEERDDWRIFYPCFARQNGLYVVCTNLVGHESGKFAKEYYPNGADFFGESRIIDPFGITVIQSNPRFKDTSLYVADIDLNLVEMAQSRDISTLNNRRPELYEMILKTDLGGKPDA